MTSSSILIPFSVRPGREDMLFDDVEEIESRGSNEGMGLFGGSSIAEVESSLAEES